MSTSTKPSAWPMAAMAFGGSLGFTAVMVTIGMGLGRLWAQIDPVVYGDTFLNTFMFLLPCIAITLLPALIGTFSSWRRADAGSNEKRRWAVTLIGLIASVVVTLIYHLPANFRIWSGDLSSSELTTQLNWWLALHALRTTAALVATIAAFLAISARTDGFPPRSEEKAP
ncbi:MAG: DUF1772 domain-containing protein [Ornithinimicrobium sp.]